MGVRSKLTWMERHTSICSIHRNRESWDENERELWDEAIDKEWDGLNDRGCFEHDLSRAELKPVKLHPNASRFATRAKRRNVSICIVGTQTPGLGPYRIHTRTARARLLMATLVSSSLAQVALVVVNQLKI